MAYVNGFTSWNIHLRNETSVKNNYIEKDIEIIVGIKLEIPHFFS